LAERQTSLEQASFNGSQISSRVFAKTKLSSAGFLTLLYLSPQVAPALIIPGLEFLNRENLRRCGDGSDHANRPANDDTRNGPTSARGSSLMDAGHSKAMHEAHY
jgi:hypothetical protein